MGKKSASVPQELEGAATVRDINTLEDRMEKCYSSERYKDFQDAVEEIIGRYVAGKLWGALELWLVTIIGTAFAENLRLVA